MHALYAAPPGRRQYRAGVVNWGVIRRLFFALLLSSSLLAGCRSGPSTAAQTASPSFKTYHLRGKVVAGNPATGEVTLNHEAIPGFMDAMTMPYKLKDPSILSELHPGDVITAELLVSQGDDATVLLDHIVIVAQGKPDYRPTTIYHVPETGDEVPDFALRNQDGRAIHLKQFRGKELLITFIYTRCPLPNFCPLVTRNFATIEKQLSATAERELRPRARHAGGVARVWRGLYRQRREDGFCALEFCGAVEARGCGDGEVLRHWIVRWR
jgi:Cu/Ag efflux protein CusF